MAPLSNVKCYLHRIVNGVRNYRITPMNEVHRNMTGRSNTSNAHRTFDEICSELKIGKTNSVILG